MNDATIKCVDCRREGNRRRRKTVIRNGRPVPGNRCATHHRQIYKSKAKSSWENHIINTYNLSPIQYWEIYESQGGRCYICQYAVGKSRRLSVDHDHATGRVRGLLCLKCNRNVLGHLRDSVEALERAIEYLENPPALNAGVDVIASGGQ